jgi:hypothetical protein
VTVGFGLVLLLAAAPPTTPRAAGVTRVSVEVFRVGVAAAGAGLAFDRREAPLERGENPDERAHGLSAEAPDDLALIHSTSWRWEPDGRIVLTYLAWIRDGRVGPEGRPLPPLPEPGSTDPLRPRPAEIRELDPLAHGLRHLAFLLRASADGTVAAALGPRAVAEIQRLPPAAAGELPNR